MDLDQLKQQLNDLLQSNPNDTDQINVLRNKISELEFEQGQQQEREQKKQETINSYVDVLPDMYEALFAQEIFSQILGLTEYAEKRQQFLQLSHTYFAEQLDGIDKQHQLDLAQKDASIQTLKAQVTDTQNQLEASKTILDQKHKDFLDVQTAADKLTNDLQSAKDDAAAAQSKHDQEKSDLNAQIEDLQAKLEAAQKPRESQPSQTLAEQINAIKSKNALSADDMIARFNSRQKNDEVKVQLPEIKPPAVEVSQFRPEDTQAEPPSDTVSPPQESEVNQFPVAPGNEVAGLPADGKVEDAAISRDEFNALKARVDKLEGVA